MLVHATQKYNTFGGETIEISLIRLPKQRIR